MSLPAQRATVRSLGWTPSRLPTAHLGVVLFKGVQLCGVFLICCHLVGSIRFAGCCPLPSSVRTVTAQKTMMAGSLGLGAPILSLAVASSKPVPAAQSVAGSGRSEGSGRRWTGLDLDSVLDCLLAASSCGVVTCTASSELLAKASVAFLKW